MAEMNTLSLKTSFCTPIPVDAARQLAQRPIDQLFITLAHKRSGHHAVIDWVLSQHDGLCVHHNFANRHAAAHLLDACDSHWVSSDGDIPVSKLSAVSVNFENALLSTEDELWATVERCAQAFPSAGRICVLIVVRDSYNNYASCLQRYLTHAKKTIAWNTDSWRGHAQLFLRAAHLRCPNVDVFGVSFNHWLSDLHFRRALAESLSVPNFLPVLSRVSPFGSGSSFDGLRFDYRAPEMPLMDRWRAIPQSARNDFLAAVSPTHALNRNIFGDELVGEVLEYFGDNHEGNSQRSYGQDC